MKDQANQLKIHLHKDLEHEDHTNTRKKSHGHNTYFNARITRMEKPTYFFITIRQYIESILKSIYLFIYYSSYLNN